MKIITWDDIRRGTLAIVLLIIPTVLIGTYIGAALQSYQITGPGLWQLKRTHVPDEVIKPLHELRLKPFFFKFRLERVDHTLKSSTGTSTRVMDLYDNVFTQSDDRQIIIFTGAFIPKPASEN